MIDSLFSEDSEETWPFIAEIIYTTAWCISFYGQIYENYKLKSYQISYKRVEGFSLDYLMFNISGYALYSIYSSIGYFTTIKGAGTVVIGDLVFVYHSVLMVIIQIYQCTIY
jgi:cystinosin